MMMLIADMLTICCHATSSFNADAITSLFFARLTAALYYAITLRLRIYYAAADAADTPFSLLCCRVHELRYYVACSAWCRLRYAMPC